MARLAGSNRKYIQAKKTVDALLVVEEFCETNLESALQVLKDLMMNPEAAAATRSSVATFIVKQHSDFAKAHGKNPKPVDFIEDSKSSITRDDSEADNILQLKFKG